MSERRLIRDLIYFDFEKTASIYSHLAGGLVTEVLDTYGKDTEKEGGVRVPVLSAGATWTDSESSSVKQITHHDLIVSLEEMLTKEEVASDLNDVFTGRTPEIAEIHAEILAKPYVRAEGKCRFHDFQRMKSHMDGINRIFEFINQGALHNLGRIGEFQKLKRQIEETEDNLAQIKDRNKRKTQSRQLDKLKDEFEKSLEDAIGADRATGIPEWQVEGIKDIIDFLMPNRNNLLLQPFENLGDFQIILNLKRDCFLDSDLDNVLFAYGSQPNVRLTVFGLVTSMPRIADSVPSFEEMNTTQTNKGSIAEFEQLFATVFDATSQVEKFGLFSYYPRVTVYPLAVYRTIRK